MNEAIHELNEKCVAQIFENVKAVDADLKGIPPAEVLISLGTAILGNVILTFISSDRSKEEQLKAAKILLQAIGGNVQNNFERIYGEPKE